MLGARVTAASQRSVVGSRDVVGAVAIHAPGSAAVAGRAARVARQIVVPRRVGVEIRVADCRTEQFEAFDPEALAQCGAILALREIADRDQKLVLFTSIKEARFRRPVVPGDTLVLEVTALRFGPRIQRMRGEAKVDGQLCADAELMSVIADRKNTPQ